MVRCGESSVGVAAVITGWCGRGVGGVADCGFAAFGRQHARRRQRRIYRRSRGRATTAGSHGIIGRAGIGMIGVIGSPTGADQTTGVGIPREPGIGAAAGTASVGGREVIRSNRAFPDRLAGTGLTSEVEDRHGASGAGKRTAAPTRDPSAGGCGNRILGRLGNDWRG